MAVFKLVSQVSSNLSSILRSPSSSHSPIPLFHRSLCSSSSSSNPEPNAQAQPEQLTRRPPPIQQVEPVSYLVKPKEESPPPEENPPVRSSSILLSDPQPYSNVENCTWTREDARYLKYALMLLPVSRPSVAPLPEDRVAEKEENEQGNEQLPEDRVEEEEKQLPFPTLIKVDNTKKEKTVFDLKEAIHLVKVSTVCFNSHLC